MDKPKERIVALSDIDLKVLRIFFDNCNPCRCSCAYPEMQGKYKTPEDCLNCKFSKDVLKLEKKIFG